MHTAAAAAKSEKPMRKYCFRQFFTDSKKQSRPNDAVKLDDIFADDMKIRGPELIKFFTVVSIRAFHHLPALWMLMGTATRPVVAFVLFSCVCFG